jgi:tetratricopeptide (TPR) repeat protein
LAALAIRRALGAEERLNLSLRIGIHTGPVVFAPVADSFRMETAIGNTANIAARLQTSAEPGTILLSEATYLGAEGYARVDAVGQLVLRGVPEPVAAYRLLGVSHRRAALDPTISAHATPLFGRERDLALLEEWCREPEAGRGRAVTIVGEPGVGKSRLLAEFRRRIAAKNITWIEGRCHSYTASIPYALVLDVLRANCGIGEADDTNAIAEKLHRGLAEVGLDPDADGRVLLHLLGVRYSSGAAAFNPGAIKEKTFNVLYRLCIEGSRRRPIVFVLEDLHWVDKVSEEGFSRLAENIGDARVLLLAAHRPEYRPPWAYKPYARQLLLRPLSRRDSLRVVHAAPRGGRLPDAVAGEIVAKGDGNPLFLEQMARHAVETEEHRSELSVPGTIHDVVMARIDRLPDESKELLQTAAVIGREFSPRLLRAISREPAALTSRLDELRRLEFIDERWEPGGVAYVFRHWLTQEAAYGSLLERRRRFYHAEIGRALETLYNDRIDEVAELLALHFGRSDDAEKAVDYAIMAAEKSQRRWASNDALSYFAEASRRVETAPDTKPNHLRRIDVVIKQGELKLALGRHAEHLNALQEIGDIVGEYGDPRRLAAWHYWAGFLQILTGGRAATAIGHCREAAEIAAAAGFHELDGFIASCLAQAHIVAGELRAAVDAGERALSIFEADGNLWWASRALWHLSSASNCLGNWRASLVYCRRALDIANAVADLRLKVAALWRTASTYIQQGDFDSGLEYCDQALELTSIPFDAAAARALRGYGLVKRGQVEAGFAELREGAAWFETSRLSHMRLLTTLRIAECYLLRNDRDSARPLVGEVLNATKTAGYVHFEGVAHRLMSECLLTLEPREAQMHVEAAVRIFDRIEAQNDFAKALVTEAELRQAEGDYPGAQKLLNQAGAIFRLLGTHDEPARVEAALAAIQPRHHDR